MNELSGNVTQMLWRAPLIQLTQIGNPSVDQGEPTTTFIAPGEIVALTVINGGLKDEEDTRPFVKSKCTYVRMTSFSVMVTETPAEIAALVNKAFGHHAAKPELKPVP